MKIRKVNSDDCETLFTWANDPQVTNFRLNPKTIQWDEHCQWFKSKLSDENAFMYMYQTDENIPAGQVRFDIEDDERAVISVSLSSDHRNKGLGVQLIKEGIRLFLKESKVKKIMAIIRDGNAASINAFTKAGFVLLNQETINGNLCGKYILNQESLN